MACRDETIYRLDVPKLRARHFVGWEERKVVFEKIEE
jgi:hypothetical protein